MKCRASRYTNATTIIWRCVTIKDSLNLPELTPYLFHHCSGSTSYGAHRYATEHKRRHSTYKDTDKNIGIH